MTIEHIKSAIRDVPDFPKPGIVFKDITPILSDLNLFRSAVDIFAERHKTSDISKVAAIDARGFIFGCAVAYRLGLGFVPIRKQGKLPYDTHEETYDLEYGSATIAVHVDAFEKGEKVLLVDDLLATGGTASAAVSLIRRAGGDVAEVDFLIELTFLKGRERLGEVPVFSAITY